MKGAPAFRELSTILVMAYLVAVGLRAYQIYDRSPRPWAVYEPFTAPKGFSPGTRFLVIARSEKCRYSQASLHFHERIIDVAQKTALGSLVLEDASTVPAEIRVALGPRDRVLKVDLRSYRIDGTPTILLVEGGKVAGMWTGQLSKAQEDAVCTRIDGSLHTLTQMRDQHASIGEIVRFPATESRDRLGEAHVLDLRSRNSPIKSISEHVTNIPADELAARMQIELPKDGSRLIIDCSFLMEGQCAVSAAVLKYGGFQEVWMYDFGVLSVGCGSTPTGR